MKIVLVSVATGPKGEAPEFVKAMDTIEVVEGKLAKLVCKVKGKPEPKIEWFKDDTPIQEDRRIKTQFDGETCTLKITDTNLDDEGEYECVATNEEGTGSCKAELLVNEANKRPEFIVKLKPVDVVEGDETRFEVEVSGFPKPDVSWYRVRDKIENGGRFETSEKDNVYSLVIKDTSTDDGGSYKCVAKNEEGEVTSRGALAVKEKVEAPAIAEEQDAAPINVVEDDELSLTVTVSGKPKPEVTWFKDGKRVRDSNQVNIESKGDKFSLAIPKIKPDDSGSYKCEVKNKAGTATRTYNVKVSGMYTVIVLAVIKDNSPLHCMMYAVILVVMCFTFRSLAATVCQYVLLIYV